MAATVDQVAQLRRMIAEPTTTTYSDADLRACIEAHPLLDERGEAPYSYDTTTDPPTQATNATWIPTYDLAAAAADVWAEKLAALATQFDATVDGATLNLSQKFTQAERMMRYYRSRRAPQSTMLHPWPRPSGVESFPWIGNLPEED